jgi:hypothetical protein
VSYDNDIADRRDIWRRSSQRRRALAKDVVVSAPVRYSARQQPDGRWKVVDHVRVDAPMAINLSTAKAGALAAKLNAKETP